MPQIQILGKEELEANNNLQNQIIERQKIVADAMYKSRQLQFYSDELKLKAKVATDEAEKARLAQNADNAKLVATVMKNAADIADQQGGKAAQDYIMGTVQQSPNLFFGLQDFYKRIGESKKSAENRIMESVADQMNPPTNPVSSDSRVGAVGGQTPSAPVIQASPAGAPVVTGISGGKPQISFPSGIAAEARARAETTKRAEREVEMEPIRKSVGNYVATFDRAVGEIGGLEDNALSALIRGKTKEIESRLGTLPNTFALQQLLKPTSLQLGSHLNRGRPTDVDQKAAEAALVRLTYTKGVNEILRGYLQDLLESNDRDDLQSKLFWSLALVGTKITGDRSTPDARLYGDPNMFKIGKATDRFTIEVEQ